MREKCRDPCPGSCGNLARCEVNNHVPICTCPEGYTGDPFSNCFPQPPGENYFLFAQSAELPRKCDNKSTYFGASLAPPQPAEEDLCAISPCGPNASCRDGICTCLPEYRGDPYSGCRPECVLNTDCPQNQACFRNKCRDPCPSTCGQNALCDVYNHIPMCSCPPSMSGNAFVFCSPVEGMFSLLLEDLEMYNPLKHTPFPTYEYLKT